MKKFTVAGFSVSEKGEHKMRFANHPNRVRVLHYAGHTDIQLYKLPRAMDKDKATAWLEAGSYKEVEQIAYAPRAEAAPKEATPKTKKVKTLTFEQALEQIPLREKGRFIKKAVREEMARELMAAQA
jgi:hypothetical protein